MRRASQVVYTIHEKKQLIGHLRDAGVEILSEAGTASFTDPHTVMLLDGRKLSADKFILCAGGRARRLDFPGAESALTHSDVWALNELPRSVVIVGGAATGCQLASIFAAFGAKVTILEISPNILQVEDQAVSKNVTAAFQSRQIEIITSITGVEQIANLGSHKVLTYLKNNAAHEIETEAVILSTGWLGNLSSLNLPAAGIETKGHYIQVNDYLQTSADHIFAAGDITGRMMLVQSAGMEALTAAENAVLGVGQPQRHQIVPHGGFTDPEYGSVGLTEEKARAAGDCLVAEVAYSELDRAVIDGHTNGVCKLVVSIDNHRILGVHVAGEQALEIVHIVAAGMASDMWVEQLAELQIAYPTYTAIIGLAARKIVRQLGVVPLAPEWRSLERRMSAEWELQTASS
jgi:dihydrolipoamide dehydrogenase